MPTTIMKGTLQLVLSIINPENVGPIAGANCMTKPANPIANPRFSFENKVNNVNCMSGIIIPAPIA